MKIIFSVGMYDRKSGIIKVVNNIAKTLGKIDGYNVSVLCTGIDVQSEGIVPDGIDIYNMDIEKYGHRKKYFYYTRAIKSALKELAPDIVVVSGTEHVIFYNAAVRSLSSDAPKMVVWEHRNFDAGPKFRLEWVGKRIAIRTWNGVLCITKKDWLQYVKHSSGPERIYQIYNLTDYTAQRETYNVASHKIISCGYLAHIKGFDMLIQTAAIVFKKHPDWSWDIYGEGTERQHLQDLIDQYGLQKHVLLKGYEKNINAIYKKYSFFVLTSRTEGMGMVLIEALRSGLPVVSFDIKCGPSDVIVNGENGYLVEPFHIEEMADRIIELMENDALRTKFSNASEMNLKEFEEHSILKKWIEMLQNVSE